MIESAIRTLFYVTQARNFGDEGTTECVGQVLGRGGTP